MNPPRNKVLRFALVSILSGINVPVLATGNDVQVNVYKGPTKCSGEAKVKAGNSVAIHYTSSIDPSSRTGKRDLKVDSSRDRGFAQAVTVGRGKVIKGLDIGLMGLCKGSSATLVVPPHLAYGDVGNGPDVPGGATIKYDIEIIDVRPEPPPEQQSQSSAPKPNEFAKIDANRDGRLSREEAAKYFESKNQPIDLDSLWKDEDKNSDGYISWEEFTGPKGDGPPRPPKRDGDKRRKEKRRQQQQQQKRPPPEKQGQGRQQDATAQVTAVFKQMDSNRDGKLSREELSMIFKEAGQEMTDEFWDESDGDGDGYVSWEEFVGTNDGGKEEL